MNTYASAHNLKYKVPLVFKLELQLVSVRLRVPKSMSLSFEFSAGKTIVSSKNFHRLEANAYETVLKETFELPIVVTYDYRKYRFSPQNIDINVLSNHGGFSKKMGIGSINVSNILNSKALVSREQVKLEKCMDKNAVLNLKAAFEFKGTHVTNEIESFTHSQISLSTIR